MDKIYTVTTEADNHETPSRCVGWFKEVGEAIECVVKNYGDIYEAGSYPYCVIEQVEPGLYTFPRKELWFRWKKDHYELTDKPEYFKGICNFSMG